MRYGMVIDLRRCIGCNACTIACKQKNGTPPGVFWSRTLVSEVGTYPNARPTYMPLLCMHCNTPACEEVCPTNATVKQPNGIVTVDPNLCMGCRYCQVACPYDARSFTAVSQSYYPGFDPTAYEKATPANRQTGVVQKCNFCMDRVQQGQDPSCVQTCPAQARFFGDLDDPNSVVSKLIVQRHGYQLHPELGTDPSVYYLPA